MTVGVKPDTLRDDSLRHAEVWKMETTQYDDSKRRIIMNINYIRCGDYLIPDFAIALETESLGKYGRMRHTYLREHCPGLYQQFVLSGRLRAHLLDIDQTCRDRIERITNRMAAAEGVNEQMKASSQLGWISRMNSIRACAEETVLSEIIYE